MVEPILSSQHKSHDSSQEHNYCIASCGGREGGGREGGWREGGRVEGGTEGGGRDRGWREGGREGGRVEGGGKVEGGREGGGRGREGGEEREESKLKKTPHILHLRVLSTLVAREWKSTTVLTSQFLMASSSRIQ